MGVTNLDELKLDKTAKVAAADATAAAGAAPTKEEFDAVVTLVNEIKTKLNAIFQV